MRTWTVTEAAILLGVNRTRIVEYIKRGYLGPQGLGKGYPRRLTCQDLRAAQIALTITGAGYRRLETIGREKLLRTALRGDTEIQAGTKTLRVPDPVC